MQAHAVLWLILKIRLFYRCVTEGDFANPTPHRSVDSHLTAILGREAMARFGRDGACRLVVADPRVSDTARVSHRHLQLRHLYDLIEATEKPVIVAGDFNTFWGENEIYLFMRAAGLKSANVEGLPTYPSRAPRKELDWVLYQEGITVNSFEVPDVRLSDHLPLICDFEVNASS